jgi:phosphatidylserine synthase
MSQSKHFKQAKHELSIFLIGWLFFAAWVIIYSYFNAYKNQAEEPSITLGMPSWVFWGIAIPWICATAFTVYISLFVIKDQEFTTEEEQEK